MKCLSRRFPTTAPASSPVNKANPKWNFRLRKSIYDRDKGRCLRCKQKVRLFLRWLGDPSGADIDHIIPRVRGGNNSPENLQLLCAICNRRKATK